MLFIGLFFMANGGHRATNKPESILAVLESILVILESI